MTMELFMKALLVTSVLTGLLTQAVKIQLDELKKTYYTNLLTGSVAIITAVFVSMAYVILMDITFSITILFDIIILTVMSWICAMIGYDKVIQSVRQMGSSNSKEKKEE